MIQSTITDTIKHEHLRTKRTNTMDIFFNNHCENNEAEAKIYENYYDVEHTIDNAQATDPLDPDNENYNQEQVFVALGRNAEVLYVKNNEASSTDHDLYVIVSHQGGQHFSRETTIEPQKVKEFYNVYEMRLRSATEDAKYKVSEYHLH